MTIGKICRSDVVTVPEKTTIQEAAQMMKEKNVGCLLVVRYQDNDYDPVGIITDRDIVVKVLSDKANVEGVMVDEVMSKDLLMLSSELGVKKTIEAMSYKGVRRAPIMDYNQIYGIVSVDDLLVMIASELGDLAALVLQQIAD
jgi:CBS domain-containing protein